MRRRALAVAQATWMMGVLAEQWVALSVARHRHNIGRCLVAAAQLHISSTTLRKHQVLAVQRPLVAQQM